MEDFDSARTEPRHPTLQIAAAITPGRASAGHLSFLGRGKVWGWVAPENLK
jgi:hypothetical protein